MKIQKVFIEFLKKEGAFNAYVKNWDKNFDEKPIKDRLCYISNSFAWVYASYPTNEPFIFWEDLNKKWRIELKIKKPSDYHTRCLMCKRYVARGLWQAKSSNREPVCDRCGE